MKRGKKLYHILLLLCCIQLSRLNLSSILPIKYAKHVYETYMCHMYASHTTTAHIFARSLRRLLVLEIHSSAQQVVTFVATAVRQKKLTSKICKQKTCVYFTCTSMLCYIHTAVVCLTSPFSFVLLLFRSIFLAQHSFVFSLSCSLFLSACSFYTTLFFSICYGAAEYMIHHKQQEIVGKRPFFVFASKQVVRLFREDFRCVP